MARTLPKPSVSESELYAENVVAVIDAEELEAAQRDPRVRAFLDEADAYLAALERQDRNH